MCYLIQPLLDVRAREESKRPNKSELALKIFQMGKMKRSRTSPNKLTHLLGLCVMPEPE